MEVKIIENQSDWDSFVKKNSKFTPFSQSWQWGDILIDEGKKVERLAVVENGEVLAQAQVIYNNLPLGMKYAFCPRGPIRKTRNMKHETQDIYKKLLNYLKDKNCIFLRIEPKDTACVTRYTLHATREINPSATLVLDLEKSEEEILKNMHSKTRYNIRLAGRKGVEIKPTVVEAVAGKNEKNLDELLRLMKKTGARDGFRLHPDKHYKQILNSELSIQLNAEFEGRIIAMAVFIKFGNTFTYLYGASDYEYRKLMAPNLLQWEGIKLGKSLGYKYYDFFGVSPLRGEKEKVKGKRPEVSDFDQDHQYSGVTRFKLGFGGEYHKDPGTFDLIINKQKYFLYKILRKVRRMF